MTKQDYFSSESDKERPSAQVRFLYFRVTLICQQCTACSWPWASWAQSQPVSFQRLSSNPFQIALKKWNRDRAILISHFESGTLKNNKIPVFMCYIFSPFFAHVFCNCVLHRWLGPTFVIRQLALMQCSREPRSRHIVLLSCSVLHLAKILKCSQTSQALQPFPFRLFCKIFDYFKATSLCQLLKCGVGGVQHGLGIFPVLPESMHWISK